MLHLPTHTQRKHLKCRFLQISWIIDVCTCFMNRLKCHLLQLVLTNWFTFWSKGGMWCLLEILPIDLQRRGQELKSCMSSEVLGNLLAPVVEENGGKNDLSMCLLSLTSVWVKGVIVSINPHKWDWPGEVPPTRVRGRFTKCTSKREGRSPLLL